MRRAQKISPHYFLGLLYLPISLYTTYFTGSIRLITVQQFFRLTILYYLAFLLLDAAAAISGAAEDAAAIAAAVVAAARYRHRPSGPNRLSSPPPVIMPHPPLFAAPVLGRRTCPRTPPSSSRTAPIFSPPVLAPACPRFPTALVSARPRPAQQCVSCYY